MWKENIYSAFLGKTQENITLGKIFGNREFKYGIQPKEGDAL